MLWRDAAAAGGAGEDSNWSSWCRPSAGHSAPWPRHHAGTLRHHRRRLRRCPYSTRRSTVRLPLSLSFSPSFLKLFSNHLYNRTDYNWHEMSVCLTPLLNFHFSYSYCMPKTNVFWHVTSHSFTLYSWSCDIYCSLAVPRHFSQCSSEIISSCLCCNKNICHLVHCMRWMFYSPSLLLLPCRCYARPGWTDHAAWSEDVFFCSWKCLSPQSHSVVQSWWTSFHRDRDIFVLTGFFSVDVSQSWRAV